MTVTIYYHGNDFEEGGELEAALSAGLCVTRSLVGEPPSDIVVGRYSVLPWYQERELDCERNGSRLIHSYATHRFIADCSEWAHYLHDVTPRTWRRLIDARAAGYSGPFVIKGVTNSRKHLWRTHMYAEDARQAELVISRLLDDSLIADQGLILREYVPLRRLGDGLYGLPISDEWRVFCLRGRVLCYGFYWTSHPEAKPMTKPTWPAEFVIREVLPRIPERHRDAFLVADVALTEQGDPILVELNDGQMSGLSFVDPGELYRGIADVLS